MSHAALDELVNLNRPDQVDLLDQMMQVLTESQAVTHLFVRGSLASGTADRLSDVDFIVGVEDHSFTEFVSVLDALVMTELGAIMPGWRDTIVGDMGGLGFVYLVPWASKLQQIDLYVVPASQAVSVAQRTDARSMFVRQLEPDYVPESAVSEYTVQAPTSLYSCHQLAIEVLVVGYLVRKRIARGQDFIAYSEWHFFTTAVKNLIKAALAPQSQYHGWYQLPAEVGSTPIGKQCLRDLNALISMSAIPTVSSLTDGLERVVAITERAAPETAGSLNSAIDAYRQYLELT